MFKNRKFKTFKTSNFYTLEHMNDKFSKFDFFWALFLRRFLKFLGVGRILNFVTKVCKSVKIIKGGAGGVCATL